MSLASCMSLFSWISHVMSFVTLVVAMLLPCWSATHHHTHHSRRHTHLSLLCWPRWWGGWWWPPLHCYMLFWDDHVVNLNPGPSHTNYHISTDKTNNNFNTSLLSHNSYNGTTRQHIKDDVKKMIDSILKIHLQVTQKLIDSVYKSSIELTMTGLFTVIFSTFECI